MALISNRRHKNRRDEDRHLHVRGRRVVVAYLLVLTCALVAVLKLQLNANAAAEKAVGVANQLHSATVAGCERLNTLQVKENVSHYADWRVFKVVLRETLATPEPSNKADRAGRQAFLTPLEQAVVAKSWTPTLDCRVAVKRHGTRYVLPQPIAFVTQLPPRSALVDGGQ